MVIKHFNSKRNVSPQLDSDDGPDSDGGDGGQQDRGQNDDLTPEAQGALTLQAAIEEDIDAQCELSAVSSGSVPAMTEDQVKCKQKILKNKKAPAIFNQNVSLLIYIVGRDKHHRGTCCTSGYIFTKTF